MKTEAMAKYVIRLAATLLVITSLVALALAGVNTITAPRIAQIQEETLQDAIREVLPGGGEEVEFTDDTGLVTAVYQSSSGYAVEVNPIGFNGAIAMMVGIDNEGNVLKIKVVSHSETPSLGAVAGAKGSAGEEFRGQYVGVNGSVAVTKDGGGIDAITGATVTSRAICEGVNAALQCVANMG